MSNKKSYMDKSNLINEGIIARIFDYLKKGRRGLTKLQRAFRDQPEIRKRIERINADSEQIAKEYKKKFGRKVPKNFFIK